jgi:hypothetical protein
LLKTAHILVYAALFKQIFRSNLDVCAYYA